ncbi:MAG: GTP cyclohydrolase I FolE, partial [Thiobacillus sp.]|nr:GTP cyclohydrolase I FolE [Thiobacillus sp.]
MSDCSDHDCQPPYRPGHLGIPQVRGFDAEAFERAVTDLLRACGIEPDSSHTGRTAQRVRELWQRRLLGGYQMDPGEALGEGFEDSRDDMVVVRGI